MRPGVQSTGAAVFRVKGSFPAAFSMSLLSTTLAHREIRRQLCVNELPPESTPGFIWGGAIYPLRLGGFWGPLRGYPAC